MIFYLFNESYQSRKCIWSFGIPVAYT